MSGIADRAAYWDGDGSGPRRVCRKRALSNAFGWTQYPGHGPGLEVLATALERG